MTSKLVNRRDLDFVLYELLDIERLTARPRYADHSRETFNAALDTAEQIAVDKFAPHNRKADLNEPHFDGSQVHMIPEVKEALAAFIDAGFMAAGHDYEFGGMQLPYTLALACNGLFKAANVGTSGYPFLTVGNANLLLAHGTPEQIERYARPELAGRYFGTMCLSEPQAGSSLADIRTTAIPQPNGSYRIVGNKMWISAGEHELSENIIHLVLARIQGAPAGIRGISLFIVPKFRVNADGTLGKRNDVALAGLNHKMGYRGTTNCVLNFGEKGDCHGELVGQPNQGLACMFHMMNEARIGVGFGAVMLGYTGYLHALDYARNRPQGRAPGAKDPDTPQVPIVQHADVRRMLLAQKAYVEGGLALCLYAASLVDEQKTSPDDTRQREAGLLLDLLTPVVKSWPSQWCLEANSLAIQVHGGYGYTREYPVEQFYRDNRLNPIHEGTHGIQAMDLLGRKVMMDGGAGMKLLSREINKTITEAHAREGLREHAAALANGLEAVAETTRILGAALVEDSQAGLANASVYLEVFGHTVVAWVWLQQAVAATRGLDKCSAADADFYRGKLQACRYFFHWELPKTQAQHALLRSLDTSCLAMADAWF
ncbi:MAG: acyl-CoA dehydrogenase [Proteobacteria bacterium]|nr:acyl-CoA dehydrogenase [Pseudomonadota bacterium]